MNKIWLSVGLSFLLNDCIAQSPITAPQPTSCIAGSFSASGDQNWQTISLKLTNNCSQTVDFQNASLSFTNKRNLNTTFWGNFSPLSYPVNPLQITSQPQASNNYLSSMSLVFPTYSGANSKLPKGSSFTLIYGAPAADYIAESVNVYLNAPVATGNVTLINATTKPANVSQAYALVNLTLNGQTISAVQVPWSGQQQVAGLATGTYAIAPASVSDSSGVVYQGLANPMTVAVTTGGTASSTLTYTAAIATGKINIALPALPSQLSGYTGIPRATLTRTDTNSASNASLNWNTATIVNQLTNGINYKLSGAAISYNGYNCLPAFNPSTAMAATTAPTVQMTYTCTQIAEETVSVNITGAPATTASVDITFTPAGSTAPVTENIPLSAGTGSNSVKLSRGTIYTVSASAINGYSVSYSPQPLTASSTSTETITYTANPPAGNSRIIGFLPGWKTPPTATALANAGYTHIMIAFGVFSTSNPGVITPAFDTVTAAYIQSLHNAGLKVLLSLGGASTSIPNTSVDFHQVLAAAPSPTAFQQTFVSSLEGLITQYGFDGFDIDIEHGLNGGGTFTNPSGDIAVMANILNAMHASHPQLLLTLTPQIANISATSGFDGTWGNYASLVMQTHQSLAWVGIQMYNSGCAYGIDLICYDPNNNRSPDASVAMATDLLANWPSVTKTGQRTGFQAYISYLTPSQVVIGYPATDASGNSDGLPGAAPNTIKRAIQCLRTGVASATSCDTYLPPTAYPGFGGVFEWEVTYDASNNYNFAKSLINCVINNNCN